MTLEQILILLISFQIKHFIADYPLQTMEMIREKGKYGRRGGIYHSLIHSLLTLIILISVDLTIIPIDYTVIFAISFVEFFIHYHIDWAKKQLTKKYSPEQSKFWWATGFDQMLHHFTYIGFVWFIAIQTNVF